MKLIVDIQNGHGQKLVTIAALFIVDNIAEIGSYTNGIYVILSKKLLLQHGVSGAILRISAHLDCFLMEFIAHLDCFLKEFSRLEHDPDQFS